MGWGVIIRGFFLASYSTQIEEQVLPFLVIHLFLSELNTFLMKYLLEKDRFRSQYIRIVIDTLINGDLSILVF